MLTRRDALRLVAGLAAAAAVPTSVAPVQASPEPAPTIAPLTLMVWGNDEHGRRRMGEVALRVDERGRSVLEVRPVEHDDGTVPVATIDVPSDVLRQLVEALPATTQRSTVAA